MLFIMAVSHGHIRIADRNDMETTNARSNTISICKREENKNSRKRHEEKKKSVTRNQPQPSSSSSRSSIEQFIHRTISSQATTDQFTFCRFQ
ncbi:hypothetical protein BJ508DRAFT_178543 [Ascobolus immersus RN42]|uniref:Uncharacterized protein n=1 Tax=Ascobolus immersus RN42 TaxID=1160509 RepID=A0A3N4IIC5_ASCIM|nr:hypothetical protein BJ508DRAFT_178543 [Ascobolus immersus RN42]